MNTLYAHNQAITETAIKGDPPNPNKTVILEGTVRHNVMADGVTRVDSSMVADGVTMVDTKGEVTTWCNGSMLTHIMQSVTMFDNSMMADALQVCL
ncbi:hypothetical protein LSAT2_022505, partial [Lamellibrachia satsuma]